MRLLLGWAGECIDALSTTITAVHIPLTLYTCLGALAAGLGALTLNTTITAVHVTQVEVGWLVPQCPYHYYCRCARNTGGGGLVVPRCPYHYYYRCARNAGGGGLVVPLPLLLPLCNTGGGRHGAQSQRIHLRVCDLQPLAQHGCQGKPNASCCTLRPRTTPFLQSKYDTTGSICLTLRPRTTPFRQSKIDTTGSICLRLPPPYHTFPTE